MTRVIGILSGKGGVGKSTTVANIGASLSFDYGYNVVAIDASTTSSSLGLYLGNHRFPATLNDVLAGKAQVPDAIYAHPSGLKLIPASSELNGLKANADGIKNVVSFLKEYVDYILLDCPPTLGAETIAAIDSINEAIIVATPEWASLLEARKTIEFLKARKKKILGLVLCRADLEPEEVDKIKQALGTPVIGVIPEDEAVARSIDKRVPVIHLHGKSRPARAYKKVLEQVTGQEFPNRGVIEKVLGWFD